MSPLKLLRASAGSGKTRALTLEYIGLLLRYPGRHRHILAVTFTNKAAGEMKSRILSVLADLSGSPDGELAGILAESTGLGAGEISRRSGQILHQILNEYSRFSVGTIDRFFQSVIRAFTREIGIQPGYNLELDNRRILSLAVDRLFQDLPVEPELLKWLIRYTEVRLDESKSWNFREEITTLGREIFQESFQSLFGEGGISRLNRENLNALGKRLDHEEERWTRLLRDAAGEALALIGEKGWDPEDFKGGARSPAVLFRQASEEGRVNFTDARSAACSEESRWLKKDSTEAQLRLVRSDLMPRLTEIRGAETELRTIDAIRSNFYALGILGDLSERVQGYLREHNLFLISDSSRFLQGITRGNQVPFIFEKTGNRYHHIMLDEFQDTSRFQYENFRPLLENSLAQGFANLVVGDVKQSIYRWRNSDWGILSHTLERDFTGMEIRRESLSENYRSKGMIIRFNNTVFQLAPQVLREKVTGEGDDHAADLFSNAFSEAVQKIPPGTREDEGEISLHMVPEQSGSGFREQVLEELPGWIDRVRANGVSPGDMAVLVRTRNEGILVAERLLNHARETGEPERYRLISSESLLLAENDAVRLLVALIRYLAYPDDALNGALLKQLLFYLQNPGEPVPDGLFGTERSPGEWMPAELAGQLDRLRSMPLYELTDQLIRMLSLHALPDHVPYLQAFQDLILDLQRQEPCGIHDFLAYWEENASRKGIEVSENSDAIRILTIHRAKGLEFKAVFLPFCNWEITTNAQKNQLLWCPTAGTPYTDIPVVPVRFSSDLDQTRFSASYREEKLKGYIDSLNLLYVAFTRATDVLVIGVPEPDKEKLKNSGDLLLSLLDRQAEEEPCLPPLGNFREGNRLRIGIPPKLEEPGKPEGTWHEVTYTAGGRELPGMRLRSEQFFADPDEQFRTRRIYGNTMHRVFSEIRTRNDLDGVLVRMEQEGMLPSPERGSLEQEIRSLIDFPGVRDWFMEHSGRRILNERSILCGDGEVIRPDRVMIEGNGVTVVDYKFGDREEERHARQVRYYMVKLGDMGYDPVEGYLWYARLGKVREVERT